MEIQQLISKYQSYLPARKLAASELVKCLKNHTEIVPVPFSELPNHLDDVAAYNAQNYYAYTAQNGACRSLMFEAYKLSKTSRNDFFYERPYAGKEQDGFIYVILEKNGFLYSNSGALFVLLKLAQGLSELDIQAQSVDFLAYLSYLDTLCAEGLSPDMLWHMD